MKPWTEINLRKRPAEIESCHPFCGVNEGFNVKIAFFLSEVYIVGGEKTA